MNKVSIVLLCTMSGSAYGAGAQQIETVQTTLRTNQTAMAGLKAKLKTVEPVIKDGLKGIDLLQAKEEEAMAKVRPHQQKAERLLKAASIFFPLGMSDISNAVKASRDAYTHAMSVVKTVDTTVAIVTTNLQSIDRDLEAITKDGGLIDEIVAAQEETISELDKARSLLTKSIDQPSDEFDF